MLLLKRSLSVKDFKSSWITQWYSEKLGNLFWMQLICSMLVFWSGPQVNDAKTSIEQTRGV